MPFSKAHTYLRFRDPTLQHTLPPLDPIHKPGQYGCALFMVKYIHHLVKGVLHINGIWRKL